MPHLSLAFSLVTVTGACWRGGAVSTALCLDYVEPGTDAGDK